MNAYPTSFLSFSALKSWRAPRFVSSLFPFVLVLMLAISSHSPALAQAQVVGFNFENHFGEIIIFTANIQADSPVESAMIFIQKQGQPEPISASVQVSPAGELKYIYDLLNLEPGDYPPRAFSKLIVWFEGKLGNNGTFSSDKFTIDYIDNRFFWNERENGLIRVHWYLGDDAFAQDVLDAASQGLDRAREILPLELENEVNIYVYASASDMQAALLAGQNWIAGQAAPDLGVSVVSLPPDRPDTLLETKRQIPHELMHILLYQHAEKGYENIPTWFNEGLASMTEIYPNPDYPSILALAVKNNTLIPMNELCGTFPGDISGALLAYAESNSFTSYLYRQVGSSGLQKLLENYTSGLKCEQGVKETLGSSLAQFEEKWLEESLGVNALGRAFRDLFPWVALFSLVVFIPLLVAFGGLLSRKNRNRIGTQPGVGQAHANPIGR